MRVAIIGAGWAGLAAAFDLCRRGHDVVVHEASRTLGGRARRVHSPRLSREIDNGQHILLGAYTETLRLLQELEVPESDLHREPLKLESADGRFRLRAARLPAPLHLLAALAGARGLSWRERLAVAAMQGRLRARNWRTVPGQTVRAWLEAEGQSANAIRRLWEPLCLAALNTPLNDACAQIFVHVLRDSLGAARRASDLVIPRVDLSRLWPERLPPRIRIRRGCPIRGLELQEHHIIVGQQEFDAVLVATDPVAAARILSELGQKAEDQAFLRLLSSFTYHPIATLTLALTAPWRLPGAMFMLHDEPASMEYGQWLFDHSVFSRSAAATCLSVVISNAGDLMAHSRDEVAKAIIGQVRRQTAALGPMPEVTAWELICEKRAGFASVPGLARPSNRTPWPRIWVAGDWTDTGYPAVLEGAVRSGRRAAHSIHAHFL